MHIGEHVLFYYFETYAPVRQAALALISVDHADVVAYLFYCQGKMGEWAVYFTRKPERYQLRLTRMARYSLA